MQKQQQELTNITQRTGINPRIDGPMLTIRIQVKVIGSTKKR